MNLAQAFDTIGAARSMPEDEIKRCYRIALGEHHPDHGGSAEGLARVLEAWTLIEADKDERAKCPTCKGSGRKVEIGRNWQRYTMPCGFCAGTGRRSR